MFRRLEPHHGFKHRKRRGVGGRLRLAGLAENSFNFRKLPQHPVLDLQNLGRLGDGHAGNGGRHEQDVPLVERRHEFLAELFIRIDRDRHDEQRDDDGEPAEAQHEIDGGLIDPNQKTVDGIFCLRRDFAAHKEQHQSRHKGDSEQCGKEHGERFCVGERLEQASFLRFQ